MCAHRVLRSARHGASRLRTVFSLVFLSAVVVGCNTRDPQAAIDTRMWTDSLAFQIRLTPRPPYAREQTTVRVVVTDKATGAPVDNGEGRFYAESHDSARVFDGLERGPEPGTYYAKVSFLTAGEWAIGLQFRRDTIGKLDTMDWLQMVRNAR